MRRLIKEIHRRGTVKTISYSWRIKRVVVSAFVGIQVFFYLDLSLRGNNRNLSLWKQGKAISFCLVKQNLI